MFFKNWLLVFAMLSGIFSVTVFAQVKEDHVETSDVRRVEPVMIDPQMCEMSWTTTKGKVADGKYVPLPGTIESYLIKFHAAAMVHNEEILEFSPEEAVRVHEVLLAISRYAAESVEWFEAQDKDVMSQPESGDANAAPPYRRVESITVTAEELRWTISSGQVKDGTYIPAPGELKTYLIKFHSATMTHGTQTHSFSKEEAVQIHAVLRALIKYSQDSVEWFENGGDPPTPAKQVPRLKA